MRRSASQGSGSSEFTRYGEPGKLRGRGYRNPRWLVGLLVCLSTLAMFTWKARQDDHLKEYLDDVVEVEVSPSDVNVSGPRPNFRETFSNADPSEEEGFDVLHAQAESAVSETELKDKEYEVSKDTTEGDEFDSPFRARQADSKRKETVDAARHRAHDRSQTRLESSRSRAKDAEGAEDDALKRRAAGDHATSPVGAELHLPARNFTCRSGDTKLNRHLPRIWAAMEAGRLRFRVG
mmetsp:Transcript_41678/g.69628  ORF Transcript_41678/g.69628 Transcript_41678/m.69628 type:complete len:236 (-) Transcript_41678:4-711(-)